MVSGDLITNNALKAIQGSYMLCTQQSSSIQNVNVTTVRDKANNMFAMPKHQKKTRFQMIHSHESFRIGSLGPTQKLLGYTVGF